MRLLRILGVSLLLLASLVPEPSFAERMELEAGLTVSGSFPFGLGRDENYLGFGLSARASYEISNWSIGIVSRGQLTPRSQVRFSTNGIQISGDLARRFISLGLVFRRFFHSQPGGARFYGETGFYGVQNDVLEADGAFQFDSVEGKKKLFFRGYGLSFGGGYRFAQSPLFLQINYEYQKYDWLQVVGTRKNLNYLALESHFDGVVLAHKIFLTLGLSEIF